jgi:hypothetical protein
MRKCSYCGRESEDSVFFCPGCGTALVSGVGGGDPSGASVENDPQGAHASKLMRQGILWFAGGAVVTFISYSAAIHAGGGYFVAYGAIIFGLVQIFRGLGASSRSETRLEASQLLDVAARLEGTDPSKSVAIYEDILHRFPGTPQSAEAQRNLQTLASQPADKISPPAQE